VKEKGFRPDEIGMYPPEDAFMNIEIFRSLHYASLIVVDLTGVRPNCTIFQLTSGTRTLIVM
jgi:hypothetical protein